MSEGITREVVIGGESEINQLTKSAEKFRYLVERRIEAIHPERNRILDGKEGEVNNILMCLCNKPNAKQIKEIRTRLIKLVLEPRYLGKHKLTPYPPNLKAVKRS